MKNKYFSLLTDLLPRYRSINSLYRRIAEEFILTFENQCQVTDFYNEFKDVPYFEKIILTILLSTDKEILLLIISTLKTEISENVDLYTANKDFFDGIDTLRVCTNRHNPLRIEIEGQLNATNEIWQKIIKVNNSLESTSWKNDKIAEERLTREEKRLKGIYKEEQEKLESLFKQKEKSDKYAIKYTENVFGKIYELGRSFLLLLDKYFPVETENITAPEFIVVEEKATISQPEQQPTIEPDMIFKTRMFEKFLSLEQKLIADKYLNDELKWISVNKTGRSDIKRLITFLVGLHENGYFMPGKDPKIKTFFEIRYNISIGQNFERKRREALLEEYKTTFFDYHF